jgi:hypothetical protein
MDDVLETVMWCYSEEVDWKICFINNNYIAYTFDSVSEAEQWLNDHCLNAYLND